MKRFWDMAAAMPVDGETGWRVLLDGRPMRLPGGAVLTLTRAALAEAVAAEWQAAGGAKGGEMSFADVPLTRLAGTAQERIAADPEPVVLELARYAESDLLCYRAGSPDALIQMQEAAWQPWLDWAAERHGARLRVTTGVVHIAQDPAALARLAAALAGHAPDALAALGVAVPVLGSLVLGLALAEGVLDAQGAGAAALVDERFQAGLWGEDAEAAARRLRIAEDIAVAGRLLDIVRAG